MLYKRKQVYWIDGYVGDKRIKMCTGCKDKEKAQKFYFNLMGESMIKNRLSTTTSDNQKIKS
tara:strand:+ start:341 stop:526 length:186 start_codon:yes stop_codon:yes gene_type:complete